MSQIVSVTFVCMGCGVRFENFKFSRKSSFVETVHLGILRKSTKYMFHDIHIFDKIEVMISWTLSK